MKDPLSASARRFGGSGAVLFLLLFLLVVQEVCACGPGRGGGRRRSPRKLTPLVFKQHVPNVSENTLAASGLREGRVHREHPRFKELVPNYNSDIIFKDEEGTGADRLMTKRCKEKLNTLAISVMNQWPGVRLRVTEGWDEEGHHSTASLHYEGRAVDITTSDRDRSKYGMLARLAVEAGFDWVYFESRSHIHCSVKSESSDAPRSGGCFPGTSKVLTRGGRLPMSELRIGDEVLATLPDGSLVYTEVVLFLDHDELEQRVFVVLQTDSNKTLTLTPEHLVYVKVAEGEQPGGLLESTLFANQVRPGDSILVLSEDNSTVRWQRVIGVQAVRATGVYAPLTGEGNIIVDDVVASCYALLKHERWAHWAFFPMRFWENLKDNLSLLLKRSRIIRTSPAGVILKRSSQKGIHWYADILYGFSQHLLPENFLYVYR